MVRICFYIFAADIMQLFILGQKKTRSWISTFYYNAEISVVKTAAGKPSLLYKLAPSGFDDQA